VFRRKRLPESLVGSFETFLAVLEPVERAKAALMDSVPTTRLPGRPLAETLLEFEEALRAADALMAGWRIRAVESEWETAREGLTRALAMAERLRLEAPEPGGFAGLIGTIQDLLDPLEAFGSAAGRFRALRT
jgi:hypothetical protein